MYGYRREVETDRGETTERVETKRKGGKEAGSINWELSDSGKRRTTSSHFLLPVCTNSWLVIDCEDYNSL